MVLKISGRQRPIPAVALAILMVQVSWVEREAMAEERRIEGTAGYRERIALPPAAVLQVELLDTTRADAPAVRISAMAYPTGGRVPVVFSLPYQADLIDPRLTYTVRAELVVDDEVMFRTTQAFPVLTRDAPDTVDLLLMRAVRAETAASVPFGTWSAVEIGGGGVLAEVQSTLSITQEGQVSGRAGCNQFTGSADIDGAGIRFGTLAVTMMACVPAVGDQEQRFLQALEAARRFIVDGLELRLLSESGDELMRLTQVSG